MHAHMWFHGSVAGIGHTGWKRWKRLHFAGLLSTLNVLMKENHKSPRGLHRTKEFSNLLDPRNFLKEYLAGTYFKEYEYF